MSERRKPGNYNELGHRIMKLARRQVALAKLLGVSQQCISRKLHGGIEWRVSELVHIAEQYEMTISELLEGMQCLV